MEKTQFILPAAPAVQTNASISREALLSPWPKITWWTIVQIALALVIYNWGLQGARVNLQELLEGIPNIINFITRLFPPEYTWAEIQVAVPGLLTAVFGVGFALTLPEVISAIIETVQMAIVGTSLAVILSLPFGLLAARNTSPHPVVYQTTRMMMNIIRAIPEIIFALIFVAAVGLGPFGGVLALAIGSIGFLGKMYAESIEAIDPQQVLAVRATGASRLHVFGYGVVPQALPLMASYSIYLFESNIRHATILGLVGAGGVGFVISKYIALFQYRKLMGAMILIVLTVTIVDRISDRLRKRFT
jgi:phosphonate transport system permease protein